MGNGQCALRLHYSVDLRIQTYTEPVPLKREELAADMRIFYRVYHTWRPPRRG